MPHHSVRRGRQILRGWCGAAVILYLRRWVCIHFNEFERVLGYIRKLFRDRLRSGARVFGWRCAICTVHVLAWVRVSLE